MYWKTSNAHKWSENYSEKISTNGDALIKEVLDYSLHQKSMRKVKVVFHGLTGLVFDYGLAFPLHLVLCNVFLRHKVKK